MTFSDADLDFVAHSLSVAAEVYLQDALTCERVSQAPDDGDARMARQFREQATQAKLLRTSIDNRG